MNKESFVFSIGKITITLLLSHMAPLPHVIIALERIQWLAIKYITHPITEHLNMLPLMYTYDLCDILFFSTESNQSLQYQ